MLDNADYLITVCGHVDERCPLPPPGTRKEHWPLDDPAKATGNEEQIMQAFRTTRDEVRRRVQELIERLVSEQEAQA